MTGRVMQGGWIFDFSRGLFGVKDDMRDVLTQPTSYIIFKDKAGYVCAKNGETGKIDYRGTDAAEVIQAAIDAVKQAGGGTVFIKKGNYSITKTIKLLEDNEVVPITLMGEGRGGEFHSGATVLDAGLGSDYPIIQIGDGARYGKLIDLQLRGGTHGLKAILTASNNYVIRCGFYKQTVASIHWGAGSPPTGGNQNWTIDCEIFNKGYDGAGIIIDKDHERIINTRILTTDNFCLKVGVDGADAMDLYAVGLFLQCGIDDAEGIDYGAVYINGLDDGYIQFWPEVGVNPNNNPWNLYVDSGAIDKEIIVEMPRDENLTYVYIDPSLADKVIVRTPSYCVSGKSLLFKDPETGHFLDIRPWDGEQSYIRSENNLLLKSGRKFVFNTNVNFPYEFENSPVYLKAGLQIDPETVKTADYTTSKTDSLIPVDTTGGVVTITLSSDHTSQVGSIVIIKDVGGNAGTNAITITTETGTIDGATSITINTNYGSVRLFSDGSNWYTF